MLAGVVGMISLTASKSSVLVGVLISVATIPAAANMGVAAAYGDWNTVLGAQIQLAVNLAGIFGASLLTLYIQRLYYVRQRRKHLSDESRRDRRPAGRDEPPPPRQPGRGGRSAVSPERSSDRRRLHLLRHAKSSWKEQGLATGSGR